MQPDDHTDPTQDELNNYGYERRRPDASRILGWLGRAAGRSADRRVRSWIYWHVPGFRSWLRYRQAGPLGRAGCVIRLLIQVAIVTVMILVLLNLGGGLAGFEDVLRQIVPR